MIHRYDVSSPEGLKKDPNGKLLIYNDVKNYLLYWNYIKDGLPKQEGYYLVAYLGSAIWHVATFEKGRFYYFDNFDGEINGVFAWSKMPDVPMEME